MSLEWYLCRVREIEQLARQLAMSAMCEPELVQVAVHFHPADGRIIARGHHVRVATCVLCALSGPAFAGDEPVQGSAPSGTKCEVAVVNPVSGYAECCKTDVYRSGR
jgi:hypothetical protein